MSEKKVDVQRPAQQPPEKVHKWEDSPSRGDFNESIPSRVQPIEQWSRPPEKKKD